MLGEILTQNAKSSKSKMKIELFKTCEYDIIIKFDDIAISVKPGCLNDDWLINNVLTEVDQELKYSYKDAIKDMYKMLTIDNYSHATYANGEISFKKEILEPMKNKNTYIDMDTDVTHIEHNFSHFSQALVQAEMKEFTIDNSFKIKIIDDILVEELFHYNKYNVIDDYNDCDDIILICNNVSKALEYTKKNYKNISMIICDTYLIDDFEVSELFYLCNKHSIDIFRSFSNKHVRFNTLKSKEKSFIGYVNTHEENPESYSMLITFDPRCSNYTKSLQMLNNDINTVFIYVQHNLLSYGGRLIKPEHQTLDLSKVTQLASNRKFHTCIAFLTEFPGIAAMLVDSGMFCTGKREVMEDYLGNVLNIYRMFGKLTGNETIEEVTDIEDLSKTLQKTII